MPIGPVESQVEYESHPAGADLSGSMGCAVKFDSSGNVVLAGNGQLAIGVLCNTPLAGQAALVMTEPGKRVRIKTGAGGFAIGGQLVIDASGRFEAAVSGDFVMAVAGETSTAANQYVTGVWQPLGKM